MHTANNGNSHAPASPGPSHSQHSHRLYHATCQRPSSAAPRTTTRTPRLTRAPSSESPHQTVISSFLQEKLQQSRQMESDKSMSWSRANTEVNSSGEFSRSLGSPIKAGEFDGHRPQSAVGSESSKKKGLGVKDMEQVISSLHKQNFDLKLELYHRRERQTALETKVDSLEMEKNRVEDTNHRLTQELEKRDKAIEEAVAMIVTLEATLEQYAKERAIVEHIEAEGRYTTHGYDPCYEDPRPDTQSPDITKQTEDGKTINRMPSFLSDRSETTENLRNVYLGTRGSVLSLAQVPEGSGDTDNSRVPTAGSPSLSVLSESSFVSVYGAKGYENGGGQEVEEPLSLDGVAGLAAKAGSINRPKTAFVNPPIPASRSARANSLSTRQPQFESINNVMDLGSPPQKSERNPRLKKADERPQSRDKDGSDLFPDRTSMSPSHRRTREDKRDSLRRVLTDAPGGVKLHDHTLPPTPDTISTSTLRRFQNSNDTLSKHSAMRRSHSALSEASENDGSADNYSGVRLEQPPMRAVKASAQIIELNNRAYLENRGRSIQRPRSADETTISHRKDWDADTDDSDVESLESSIDIWMRESAKPSRNGGRISPDLFSFPSNAAKGGWTMDAMYGSGSVHAGGASTGIDPEKIRDLFPVQQELFSSSLPPPPPNRRSSLNAQTVPSSKPSLPSRPQAKPKASKSGRKNRHQRRNSDDLQMRAEVHTQAKAAADDQKKNHYPPITGQHAVRNGLTKLFRRSIGSSSSNNVPPPTAGSDSGATEPTNAELPNINGATGLPSWISRTGVADEDRESATPPPIMRNPRHGRLASIEVGMANDSIKSQEPTTPIMPMAPGQMSDKGTPEQQVDSPRTVSATGTRKKWLPAFGRNRQG
ncbi:hypothetical protein F66182_7843 [Fusarium sp. NRRL 66182]|nr:hypothetical protein F66182_7843 [Fusarium sp. NRRL 66182]